jgi:hypothetical protein
MVKKKIIYSMIIIIYYFGFVEYNHNSSDALRIFQSLVTDSADKAHYFVNPVANFIAPGCDIEQREIVSLPQDVSNLMTMIKTIPIKILFIHKFPIRSA